MSKFTKPGAQKKNSSGPKKGHSSPMQKKDWIVRMESYEDAVPHMINHVNKGATWSGDELRYLNALWDATVAVATELGYVDQE